MVAIAAERFDAARTLLAIDRGLDRRDANGLSAMHYAAVRGNPSLVQDFIKAGYDLRHKSPDGASLLFYAAVNPKPEIFEWLLGQGLDPRERTAQDETILMAAASAGQSASIQRLIALGLDVNRRDRSGRTALMNAAYSGQPPAMQLLLKARARLDVVDMEGNTPLHNAAAGGQRDMLQLLLQRGVPVNAEDKKGRSPLIVAMMSGKWDAAHFLLGRGARLTTSKLSAEQIAEYLISRNQPEILRRYLVAYPPLKELMQRDPHWLQYAAKTSGGETIKFLADLGARIDHPGSDGLTPLLTACSEGNQETVRALLELKADHTRRNQRNQTALRIATLKGYPKIVQTLREFQVKE
jgi:ankyrin repeat protein